jgi:RNA polymerase sigma-70 factor (ECF subfamily)
MLRSSDDADSASQDVFIKAYRALERNEKEAIESPAKWLTRVAVNTCLDRLRSKRWLFWQKRASQEDEQTILRLTPASGPNQEDALVAREITRRLNVALDKLSVRQRSVFVLRHDEDRSLEDIGEILGLDVGTVKAHMARAVRKLREELRDLYGRQTLER